jgi:hypothetical protein
MFWSLVTDHFTFTISKHQLATGTNFPALWACIDVLEQCDGADDSSDCLTLIFARLQIHPCSILLIHSHIDGRLEA